MLIFQLHSTSGVGQAGQWIEPYLPPLFSQKNEMFIFGLCSTSDVGWAGQWTQTPTATPLQPKK